MSKFPISLKKLENWFQRQKRILPWRDQPTVYRVWISEIMLQQTQVITVIPYFERFIARFPTVEELAAAPEEDVLKMWAGLGYYSRARNIHRAAKQVVQKGKFPENREEWLDIPGVGEYTAGAILSIAGNLPEPILDGNVERVLSRVRRVDRKDGDSVFKQNLWKLSEAWIGAAYEKKIQASVFNQALMELGAMVCIPKSPHCLRCPLQEECEAFQRGEVDLYPPKKKKKEWIQVQENMHCILDEAGRVLLRQRQKGEWRAGLWDLLNDLPKEMKKKWNLEESSLGEVESRHIVTRHKIQRSTSIWRSRKRKGTFLASEPDFSSDLKWVSIQSPDVAVGSALKKTLKVVLERLEGAHS